MRAINRELTLLSKAEQAALYELPDFDENQRLEFLTLTEEEQNLVLSRPNLSAQIYCCLQISYFKSVKMFFRFAWNEPAPDDINFVHQQYFAEQPWKKQIITKHEHYIQCNAIAALFGYRTWSTDYEELVQEQIAKTIRLDINPQFIVMELLSFFQEQKIIRPRYTTLQVLIRNMLTIERNRMKDVINNALASEEKLLFQNLLIDDNSFSKLAAIKQDAKDFKAHTMIAEREKLATIAPLYQIAESLLLKLNLSQQNIHYYASLVDYYTIFDLREKIKPDQTYLYLICYIWKRYQQLNDNLINAFCYLFNHFEDEITAKTNEVFAEHAISQHSELLIMRKLAQFYVDEQISDDDCFGKVREKAFTLMSKDELSQIVSNSNEKSQKKMDFLWDMIDKIAPKFKLHLRPIALALNFSSTIENNPWIEALTWFKEVFPKQKNLNKCLSADCPEGTVPKRLEQFLLATDDKKQTTTIKSQRYEFWAYRQIVKQINKGDIYLEDSVNYRSLGQELVSLEEKDAILKQLDIPALRRPINEILNDKFTELNQLWVTFNDELSKGKLKHLRYDEKTDTIHMQKIPDDNEEELQHDFYQQLPLCDITDVMRFVNEMCNFLSAFTHIQPRYTKQPVNIDSLIGTIIAQAMNNGNLNMSEISDISYDLLQDTLQSRVRLATLKAANDIISNAIAKMSIFPFYSFDMDVLYGGVDGQKFGVERPTIKARHSKKHFGKGKGVVAYTMLANHIPLQVELIGANEHESYFVFDIWHNNTSNIMPDVITGDMHCINKANFGIMDWFDGKLYPRFTNLQDQRKHLHTGFDTSQYKDWLIKPAGQINWQLIESEWPNLQRIIATLGLKEITQSTIIRKLCTHSKRNRTYLALFEYDKLIRSIHTLKYFLDPKIQRDTHRSQNRVEAYHQLRGAIAQSGGGKELTGRTDIAIEISNQCGRLIANAIIFYNSAILSKLRDKYEAEDNQAALGILKKISPVAWRHIHFQGHFKFSEVNAIDLEAIIEKLILSNSGKKQAEL